MGVAVSKTKTKTLLDNVFNASVYNKCPQSSIKQVQQVGDITVSGCDANIVIGQEAYLDDACTLSTTIDSLTDYYVKNKQQLEQGLVPNLVNVSNTSSEETIRQEIQADIQNMCPDVVVDQEQVIGNVVCQGSKLNLPILQKFSGRTSCVVNELLKRADKWETDNEQKVEQSSGIGAFFQKWLTMQMLAIVLVVIVILALLYWLSVGDNAANAAKVGALLL